MRHRCMRDAVEDLERQGHLIRIRHTVDPDLEMAEIHRRVFRSGGPALLFEDVKGSPFPAVSNLFGTEARWRFLFRDTLAPTRRVVGLRADPTAILRAPVRHLQVPWTAARALPKRTTSAPVLACETRIDQLPQIRCWPMDGGPYILLPQVFTEHPDRRGVMGSNLGMYRIQLAGNDFGPDRIGLHYQLHRGIGVHHEAARRRGEPLRVSIFVGGPPAHTFAAVMPLPEGLSELVFAGMLAGRRFRWTRHGDHIISSEADFCIIGTVDPTETAPEGPFGDHLGYYSLQHDFPVLRVEKVFHRADAIWPFTVVGRPPQEDSSFGAMIGQLVAPMVPAELPGLVAMHAVDVAGVHPLLLASGSERYVPWAERAPRELLTQANAVLGFNQASLAKYLIIAAHEDGVVDPHDVPGFLSHVLARIDTRRDLHFQTRTTMDTLDYSGTALNEGSKVVMAAAGPARRTLAATAPAVELPEGFGQPRVVMPGVLALSGPAWSSQGLDALADALALCPDFVGQQTGWPWLVVVDDTAELQRFEDFLWVVFTRSNPSHDIYGVQASIEHKHWSCDGSILIDARIKEHHAPPLVEDAEVTARVDVWMRPGGPLAALGRA